MRFSSLSLGAVLLALTTAVNAHSTPCAQNEFNSLKEKGEWFNYIQNHIYLEVVGTRFIGLEMAWSEKRTCLFGFNQPLFQNTLIAETRTGFVCFDKDKYEIRQLKEHCILGEENCEMDPAGISIGIGNIKIFEPTIEALPQDDLNPAQALNYFGRYPRTVTVQYKPERRLPSRGILNLNTLNSNELNSVP